MKKKIMFLIIMMLAIISTSHAYAYAGTYELPSKAQYYYLPVDEDGNILSDEWTAGGYDTYKYNSKGHLTSFKSVRFDPWGDRTVTTQKTKWTYKKGRISGSKTTNTYNSDGSKDVTTYKCVYDNKSRLIKETEKMKYAGDKKTYTSVCNYYHNKKGWITKRTYKVSGKSGTNKIKTSYHDNGMPKSMSISVPGIGQYKSYKLLYKFNEKGLVVSETMRERFDEENIDSVVNYIYEYDDQGRVKTVSYETKLEGEYKIVDKVEYTYGTSRTSDKRVYFGIMNHQCGCLIAAHAVVPGAYYFMQ